MYAQRLLGQPWSENIGQYALFNGAPYRIEPMPFNHLGKLDPTDVGVLDWLFTLLGM